MLKVSDISFSYHPETPVLQGVSFALDRGEHLCVMGESGCGKSTLLKAVYGLLDLDKGSIEWKGQPVLGPAYHLVPGMPFFKYVAQDYDLMPFTSVEDNVSKFLSRVDLEGTTRRTRELLELIDMLPFAEVRAKDLSGGQKQRVALARALARDPELLLLEKPFSKVDNSKKNELRRRLFSYLKEKNIACLVATHDSEDALSFADKMIVIRDHGIVAYGSPGELYSSPPSHYVASLFDDVNVLESNGATKLLYPHQIQITDSSTMQATVLKSFYMGSHWLLQLDHAGQVIYVRHHESLEPNTTTSVEIPGSPG